MFRVNLNVPTKQFPSEPFPSAALLGTRLMAGLVVVGVPVCPRGWRDASILNLNQLSSFLIQEGSSF